MHFYDRSVGPHANAAIVNGSTRKRFPAACDGSMMTGRWLSDLSIGTALISSVFRVQVQRCGCPARRG